MKYKVYYQENQKLNSKVIYASSIEELKKDENYPSNVIKIKYFDKQKTLESLKNKGVLTNHKKLLLETFKQIQTMINANITFYDAISLILKNKQDSFIKSFLEDIQRSIKTNKDIEKLIKKYGTKLDSSVVLFLKLGLEKGNIKDSVNSIVKILSQDIEAKGKLRDAIRYPMVVFGSIFIGFIMIVVYVLPKFHMMFKSHENLPIATKLLFGLENILTNYWYMVIVLVLILLLLGQKLYQKYISYIDKFVFLYVPVFKSLVRSYIFYKMFLSMYVVVRSKYQFQVAIEHSYDIVQNSFVKAKLKTIIIKIKNGIPIAKAFESSGIFDDITIRLLYTAQHTSSYENILEDIVSLYKKRFDDSIKNFASIIDPLLIFSMAMLVLTIVLAIFVPLWDMNRIVGY